MDAGARAGFRARGGAAFATCIVKATMAKTPRMLKILFRILVSIEAALLKSQPRASRKSSDFLEYDFYRVATSAAFCRATERAIDLAHPQTRHTTNGRPHLRLAQEIARADDHETILTEHAHRDVAHSAG